jgi:c-di-GMP-binding flagellar brake protein YcgR
MELTPTQFAEVRQSLTSLETEGKAAEKRRFSRMKVQAKVTLTNQATGQTYSAMTRDLSQSGMGVVQSLQAHKGQKFVATLPRSENNSVQVLCQVVDARPLADGLHCVHLEFESLPDKKLSGTGKL